MANSIFAVTAAVAACLLAGCADMSGISPQAQVRDAASLGLSAGAVVGELDDGLELPPGFEVASLVAGVGREAALGDPARSVTLATERMLDALLPG